jgi:glutamate synthase (NADPH/NADH) small chain
MQIEIMPKPPVDHNPDTPWPMYPQILKTSSSHEEGCVRRWNLKTCRFIGENNHVKGVEVENATGEKEIIEADLVLLAMGFVHPEQEGLVKELSLPVNERKNIAAGQDGYTTGNIFACGDATSGASLVVTAMASGKKTADAIHRFLCLK